VDGKANEAAGIPRLMEMPALQNPLEKETCPQERFPLRTRSSCTRNAGNLPYGPQLQRFPATQPLNDFTGTIPHRIQNRSL
jgi:hypothetical protein